MCNYNTVIMAYSTPIKDLCCYFQFAHSITLILICFIYRDLNHPFLLLLAGVEIYSMIQLIFSKLIEGYYPNKTSLFYELVIDSVILTIISFIWDKAYLIIIIRWVIIRMTELHVEHERSNH